MADPIRVLHIRAAQTIIAVVYSLVSTSNWHVSFTRLYPARHLRTWLTTYTWFRKVQDVGSARPPTDRVLFHAHITHFGDRSFAAAGPPATCLEQLSSTLARLRCYQSPGGMNRKRIKLVLMLLPRDSATSCLFRYINALTELNWLFLSGCLLWQNRAKIFLGSDFRHTLVHPTVSDS